GRVIDLGAGTGRYTFAIAKAHPDAFVVAVDTQPGFVRIIAQRCLDDQYDNVVTGDTPAGPPADRILLLNVLHEMSDLELNPVRAALSSTGWMLVIDWDAAIERPVGPPKEHSHTREAATARLQSRGFTSVEPITAPEFPYHFALRVR
ncbi:MAG TPA: class I SAM-dependent methyltransferase, partial [Candidatus Dormibacteraeota bacterium]|nr:class I SAM-dependent methyltransferase [Candidatus Dormibacteraeota bacterium]